jgi:hypothetical protein
MGCRNKNLLGRAATVWTGATEIPFLDKCNFLPDFMGNCRHTESGIAAT